MEDKDPRKWLSEGWGDMAESGKNCKWLRIITGLIVLLVIATVACDGDSGTDTTTTEAEGNVGTRENPVPLNQEAQVGDWKAKVVEANLDAWGEVSADPENVNDEPEPGHQYVLVLIEATYTGGQSSIFWLDVLDGFVGSKGNTFDSETFAPDSIVQAGEAFPGASISGNLLFAVASDQVSGGTLMVRSLSSTMFFAVE